MGDSCTLGGLVDTPSSEPGLTRGLANELWTSFLKIALFFTGQKHAGENLQDVLKARAAELDPPIQMCDALSRNTSPDFEAIVANCLVHGRRKFVEVAGNFPSETRHVLEVLGEVYKNDADTKKQGLKPEQRQRFHWEKSRPLMTPLRRWMRNKIHEREVEPNSGLGEAIAYMDKHWKCMDSSR